jgi:aryl-alcohol dehydrogenase
MKITAAVVREKSGPFRIEEVDLEEPSDNEVLIRIVAVGLCHTDLVARDQYLPFPLPAVLGHEGAGIVERVGSRVTKVAPGDHVVLSYLTCGTCPSCTKGMPGHCLDFLRSNFTGARFDGTPTMKKNGEIIHGAFFGQSSFASHALANERNVVKVRKDVPLEILGPLGCGFQTGAGGVINSLHPKAGSSIAVFGIGSVGLSAIMAAVACGCTTIIAVDTNVERLKTALEFGATHIIDPNASDPVAEIQGITGPGADYSLECTGIPKVFRQTVDAIRIGGVCGLIGVAPFGAEVSLDMQNILNGRTIKGIVEGDSVPDIFIPQLIELNRLGRLPFDKMIKFYPMDQINQAAEDSEKGITLKAILRP